MLIPDQSVFVFLVCGLVQNVPADPSAAMTRTRLTILLRNMFL